MLAFFRKPTHVAALVWVGLGTSGFVMKRFETPRPRPVVVHLALKQAEPAVNSTVAKAPEVLKLWFTEPVTAANTKIHMTGPDGAEVELGGVAVDSAAMSPATAMVHVALGAGRYRVTWNSVAPDGDPAKGFFAFTVGPAKP